jgi:DNA-damage-inducible protein J
MLAINKTAVVRSRIEPAVKVRAERVLQHCGLDLSTAIRLFLGQVVALRGLPFEVKVPNATTIAAMEEARTMTAARFGSAKELFDDLEGKTSRAEKGRARKKRG